MEKNDHLGIFTLAYYFYMQQFTILKVMQIMCATSSYYYSRPS